MPIGNLDHLPLPNLASYSVLSIVGFTTAIGYAIVGPKGFYTTIQDEVWCTWALLNMACCCLFISGQLIVSKVFGKLRICELQHLRDKFWNFVFYKFIFVFGVMDVQNVGDILGWCMWFAALGFFSLISQLCRDRFEFLSFSPNIPVSSHLKVVALLSGVLVCCGILLMVCTVVGWQFGISYFSFLSSEVFILSMRTVHILIKYIIHLWDMHHNGPWEHRLVYMHYFEIVLELAALSVDFLHHLHMILWGNWFPSMASLVLMMKLRFLYQEIQQKFRKHRTYLQISNTLEKQFPLALPSEIQGNECPICWEPMQQARKLPCGHVFHTDCLRGWLQQDLSCPYCWHSLKDAVGRGENEESASFGRSNNAGRPATGNQRNVPIRNRLLHFNGTYLASWLPTFSVEVHDTELMWLHEAEELYRQAETINSVYPHVPLSSIIIDLTRTRSPDQTADNIINGTIYIPSEQLGVSSRSSSRSTTGAEVADQIETRAVSLDPPSNSNSSTYHRRPHEPQNK